MVCSVPSLYSRTLNPPLILTACHGTTRFGWFPNQATYLPALPILAGDALTLNITAARSLASADFSVTNHRTGQTAHATLADQAPMLCGFHAEWIVEDFWATDGVPLADFGNIAFSAARFGTDLGVGGGVQGAKLAGVKESEGGKVVIECGKVGGEGVSCDFRGSVHV